MEKNQKKDRMKTLYLAWGLGFAIFAAMTGVSYINGETDLASIVINGLMLVIVLIIFIRSGENIKVVQSITNDLNRLAGKIESDFAAKNAYLWEEYKTEEPQSMFSSATLISAYSRYRFERERLAFRTEDGYKCSLDEYINEELVDASMKKNVLNLIPGVMTGFGILGTFIGLSIALQNFSTGSPEEITNSIPKLMDGIKVAFHTSIYGISFSLIFNYVYKVILEEAYIAVDSFLKNFDTYVDTDAMKDNESATQLMLQKMPEEIGKKVSEFIRPVMDTLNKTLVEFSENVAKSQLEGVNRLVDHIMNSMNTSLGDSFRTMQKMIDDTNDVQHENNVMMMETLTGISAMVDNLKTINEASADSIRKMHSYISKVDELQAGINENYEVINSQTAEQWKYVEEVKRSMNNLMKQEAQMSKDIASQLAAVQKMEKEITSLYNNYTGAMDSAAKRLSAASTEIDRNLSRSLDTTFAAIDKNLADITLRLSKTIKEIDETTEKVPRVVKVSYDGMKSAFRDMQNQIEGMNRNLEETVRRLR